jgi:hypothetical protein
MADDPIVPQKELHQGAPSPSPLDYQTPVPVPRRVHPSVPFIGGLLLSIGPIAFVSAGVFMTAYNGYGPNPRSPNWLTVGSYLVIAVLAVAGCFIIKRKPMGGSRWFVLGLLIGTGLTGLLEGVCFAVFR